MKNFAATPQEVAKVLQSPAGRHLPYQQVHNNITLLNLQAEVQDIRPGFSTDPSLIAARVGRLCDVLEFLLANNCIDVSSTYKK